MRSDDASWFGRRAGARTLHRLQCFAKDESGSVTVEMVLWLPLIFGLLMLIIDVSLAFFGRAHAFRLIQDFNRMVSVGAIEDEVTAETRILAAFEGISPNATANVTIENGFVRTVLWVPVADLILFSSPFLVHDFSSSEMTIAAQHFIEWPQS